MSYSERARNLPLVVGEKRAAESKGKAAAAAAIIRVQVIAPPAAANSLASVFLYWEGAEKATFGLRNRLDAESKR